MKPASKLPTVHERVRQILESARGQASRSVNTIQVVSNWMIGREIVEEEQMGRKRAGYGKRLIEQLADKLMAEYGPGYTGRNLAFFREFYRTYPRLLEILYAARTKFVTDNPAGTSAIPYAARTESGAAAVKPGYEPGEAAVIVNLLLSAFTGPYRDKWQPGCLHPNLSWTHYRTLMRVEKDEARSFYEIEALKNHWAARELERQIGSLLYERLALSKDKPGLLKLANKGHQIQQPADVFKDPVVIEFLGLPESPKLVESQIEAALINNLQAFLLEMGKGFAFVARQKRITLDGDHFYIDLVFYHTILKCYVVLDLKTGPLTHQDLGQLQLYVNFFDREIRTEGDNPTLGLILCTDKNDTVVKYTLGPEQQKTIFTSRYKLHLPTEKELQAEIRRELKELGGG